MVYKTAYLWGPVSSFSGQLAAFLVQKGWQVHIATKSAFHFALSPLDLCSAAQNALERALGGHDQFKIFEDRIRFLDVNEAVRGTKYDVVLFCGLPPNFDESRVSRAPWAANDFAELAKRFKDCPFFIVSSIWSTVQKDGVVPEEIECERRKPTCQFEAACQQYEIRISKQLDKDETPWYLVRLPMITGSTADGHILNFSGITSLLQRLDGSLQPASASGEDLDTLRLSYNPDATMWFLPVDNAVQVFWKLLEDEQRPRITNLVNSQATLNQEWLQHLAKALGYKRAQYSDHDNLTIPTVLRKSLTDNILVKTRGLFEVMGRYQQPPTVIDSDYFERLLTYCRRENWGNLSSITSGRAVQFSDDFAKNYFTEFLPLHVDCNTLKEVTGESGAIAFAIDDNAEHKWVLSLEDGHAKVDYLNGDASSMKVKFWFSQDGILNLVQRKVSLERALVTREARVEGNPLQILKACNILKRLLKEHPYKLEAH